MNRHVVRLALLLVCALILAACSSSDDDGGTAPPPPGGGGDQEGELLWEETTAALDDAGAVIDQMLGAGDLLTVMNDAAAALGDHQCVATVAVDSNSLGDPQLVAEFANGVVLVVPVIRVDSLRLEGIEPPEASEPVTLRPRPSSAKNNALPEANQVLLLDSAVWDTDVNDWGNLLVEVGYDGIYTQDFPVAFFKSLAAYDLVYISTHGLLFKHRGQAVFGMTTTQYRSTDEELAMLAARDFQDLAVTLQGAIYIPENEDPYHPTRVKYMVTDRYILKYNPSFNDNSIFYADCCESMLPSGLPEGIPLLTTLGEMNVGTLIGWDGSVDENYSTPAANTMIGRLLGNMHNDLRWTVHPTPPIRPWTLVDTFASLQRTNMNHDGGGVEMLMLQLAGTPEPMLRPNIGQCLLEVDPEADTEELKLLGRFGDTQGTVMLYENPEQAGQGGGTQLTVSSWEPTRVIAQIDEEQAGYVQVKTQGIPSNIHPLSRWSGDFESAGVAPTGIGPQFSLVMHNSWRGEICRERVQPEGDPHEEAGWTGTMLGKASECEFEFTGTFEDSRYIYEYPEGANQGTQPMGMDGMEMFFGSVVLKPSEGEASFQILLSREAVVMKTDKQNPELPPVQDTVQVSVGAMFTADITPEGVISEGQTLVPYPVTWPEMTPVFPVREDTGR